MVPGTRRSGIPDEGREDGMRARMTQVTSDIDQLRMAGSRPGSAGSRPRTYAVGRTCVAGGCETVLSRYNPTELCWQHEPLRAYITAVRGRRPSEIEVLNELVPRAS
jgi:hypothetical protein